MLLAMISRVTIPSLLLITSTLAQTIFPSNNASDLFPAGTSPRFLLNGTEFSDLPVIHIAPLGIYAQILHSDFVRILAEGHLVNIDASNVNTQTTSSLLQFSYLSCDPGAYTGNLNAIDVLRILTQQNSAQANVVILYSTTAAHCGATGLQNLPTINSILTTTDKTLATMLAQKNLGFKSPGTALILPDLNSYTNGSGPGSQPTPGWGSSPTTAVAMIILYSITGIITALFVVIIVTGAIKAHRHPERYGPRNVLGRGRQSRARGIARAMLETLPIVKFGDREGEVAKPPNTVQPQSAETAGVDRDIEMNATTTANTNAATEDLSAAESKTTPNPNATNTPGDSPTAELPANNADGTDDLGHLGCSICTEDFTRGEEVRVLPCNHKFHPDCVDPWLLNVSGTCPLCRIDLRPKAEVEEEDSLRGLGGVGRGEAALPPPLGWGRSGAAGGGVVGGIGGGEEGRRGGRRDTFASLRQMANLGAGSREERIAALRRLRVERQERLQRQERQERMGRTGRQVSVSSGSGVVGQSSGGEEEVRMGEGEAETERRGLARRFRERFRIRTERNVGGASTSVGSGGGVGGGEGSQT